MRIGNEAIGMNAGTRHPFEEEWCIELQKRERSASP